MFTDLFDELYSQLTLTIDKLKTSPDESALEKVTFLTQLRQKLGDMNELSKKQQESEKNVSPEDGYRISSDEAGNLSRAFNDFAEGCREFTGKYSKEEISGTPLESLVIPVSNLLVPTTQFAGALRDIQEGKEGSRRSLKEVYSDVSWTGSILNPDPAISKKYDSSVQQWKLKEKTIEESFPLYRDALNKAASSFANHYVTISGNDNFEEAINYKFRMVAASLGDSKSERQLAQRVLSYAPDIKAKYKKVTQDPTDTNPFGSFNDTYFEHWVNSRYDMAFITGNVERSSLTGGKEQLIRMVHDITVRPHFLGIDEQTFGTLNSAGDFIDLISGAVEPFAEQMLKNPRTADLPEVKQLAEVSKNLKTKIVDFLQRKDESPTTGDFVSVMDSLSELITKIPPETRVKSGFVATTCYDLGIRINGTVPGVENALEKMTGAFEQKGEEFYHNARNYIISHAGDLKAINKQMDFLDKFNDADPIADANKYNSVYYTALFANPDFAAQELERKEKELEHYKKESTFGFQQSFGLREKMAEGSDHSVTLKERESREVKRVAREILLCRFAKNEGASRVENAPAPNMKDVSGMMQRFCKNAKMNTLLRGDSKTICDFIVPDSPEDKLKFEEAQMKLLYDRYPKLNADCVHLMTEKSRGLGKGNSDSYTAVSRAIEKINGPGVSRIDDYENLYNSVLTYVKEHDSMPKTKQGQMRFLASARLLADVGMTIAEEKPELREKIRNDFGVTMMRCNLFRDYVTEKSVKIGSKETEIKEFCQNTIKDAAAVSNALGKDGNTGMLTGSIKNEKQNEELLKAFNRITSPDSKRHEPEIAVPEKKKENSSLVMN